jgi:hypothetical protein
MLCLLHGTVSVQMLGQKGFERKQNLSCCPAGDPAFCVICFIHYTTRSYRIDFICYE